MVDIGKLNNHRTHRGPVGLPLSPRLNGSPALRFASDASCLFHGALVPPTYATTRRPASPRAVDLVDLRRVRPSRSGRTRTAYHPVGSRRFERRAAPVGTLHGLRPQGCKATASKLARFTGWMGTVPCHNPALAAARSMTEEIDIWRAAHLLVKRHGNDAATVAAQRADELLAQGDLDGQSIWKRIVSAVRELQRTKLTANERRN